MSSSPIIISLDGNIGAGKSTLLDAISKKISFISVVPEPVGDWLNMKNENGDSLLSLFYKDTSRWCYTFQNCALLTRLMETQRIIKEWDGVRPVILTERSIMTDRYVFAEMLHRQGKMDDLEWQLYLKWFDYFAKDAPVKGVIHLNTSVNTSKSRIGVRGRKGEEDIPLQYLQDLDEQHLKWFRESHLPTLEITTDEGHSIEDAIEKVDKWISANFL
jgi:deoxyadenosine/deoxycytidine kinase